MAVIVETFETACTWAQFPELHAGATAAVEKALAEICGGGWVTCRFTHVYPDGPAPYFSVHRARALGRRSCRCGPRSRPPRRRRCSPTAARSPTTTPSAATTDPGTTGSVPIPFAAALAAVKRTLDPAGDPQPGVLIDP